MMESFVYSTSTQSLMFRRVSAVFWVTALVALVLLYWVTGLSIELPGLKRAEIITKREQVRVQIKLVPTIQYRLSTKFDVMLVVFGTVVGHRLKTTSIYLLLYTCYTFVQGNWSRIEPQLQPIVSELNKQHDFYSEFKFDIHLKCRRTNMSADKTVLKNEHVRSQFNNTSCPLLQKALPKTDIQMLSMYDKIVFDNMDGGVWSQGWDITYKEDQWNQTNKLKVFIVPHSHLDPGWMKPFEYYVDYIARYIFTNMVQSMSRGIGKFIWAEISFLAKWWERDATNNEKEQFISLLKNNKIEIVTGGWVMNDEANSHWLSTIQQLTLGHQWCLHTLGVSPKNAWSIDPFGYSSSQPYLLKLSGLDNSVIHRVHYRLKKEFASKKQLEFRRRQLWDGIGTTESFTHLLPFYSYDIPRSCGPDPKICCQFDFARIYNGVTCPWGISPQYITPANIKERASLILDQWRKKTQLYRSNVLLFPLGDDLRYHSTADWVHQFQNYNVLMNYINMNETLNTEVQFGNLEDYFQALHSEVEMSNFPVLSGDFFTYADSDDHYWSGYYTSRPFYKNMERVLLAYLRAAETISSQTMMSCTLTRLMSIQLQNQVGHARRTLALFQHHDAISGTSRSKVVKDYAKKMLVAIRSCQSAIQQATHYLLKEPSIMEENRDGIYFDESWRRYNEIPCRITILLNSVKSSRKIALYNSLSFTRREILTVFVSSPDVEVFDPSGNPIMAQVSPTIVSHNGTLAFADYKYQVSFPVVIHSLALAMYTVALRKNASDNNYTSYARVRVYNAKWTATLPKAFLLEQSSAPLVEDITIQSGNGTKIVTTMNGLIKAIVTLDGEVVPVQMGFAQYDSQTGENKNSGAYLFHPTGPSVMLPAEQFPEIVVTEGIYKATLYTVVLSLKVADIALAISVYNNPSLQQSEVEISNTFLIDPEMENMELSMLLSSNIQNGDVFYTDVNGMHMIKRRHFHKLPIQANFYPMPAAAYIEDVRFRLTLLASTPLGVAALQAGQIEVIQDRRLSDDDSRGLNQGVLDNVRTRHKFRLIVERAKKPCPLGKPAEYPGGHLTLGTHVSQQCLIQPLIIMHYTAKNQPPHNGFSRVTLNAADIVLGSYQTHVTTKTKDGDILHGIGLTFQRVHLDTCYGDREISKWYQLTDGQVQMSDIVDISDESVYESTLTFITLKDQLSSDIITLCPQDVKSVFINKTLNTFLEAPHLQL